MCPPVEPTRHNAHRPSWTQRFGWHPVRDAGTAGRYALSADGPDIVYKPAPRPLHRVYNSAASHRPQLDTG